MPKIGAFVGKFLPPHVGHMSVIDLMRSECDISVVVLSDSPARSKRLCREAGFPYFSSKKRMEWLKKQYAGCSDMRFYVLDESFGGKYSEEKFAKLFHETIKEEVNVKYAEPKYRALNEKYFSQCEFREVPRNAINISGTMIRERPNAFFDMIMPSARQDIAEKTAKIRQKA